MLAFLFRPLRIGTLFRIPVLLVPATPLLVAILLAPLAATEEGFGTALVLVLLLAVSLLAHEFAHALVARALGLHVLDVTIWPLGGMARLEGMTERPRVEAPVAAAGPVANLVLAGICALLPWHWAQMATWLNLVLGVGNLVPAFPLDGGRLLRAWLARANPQVDATRAAVRVARWLAFLGLVLAIGNGHWLIGLVLAIYVWWSGQAEFLQVLFREGRPPTLSTGEVFRRAWRGAPDAADADVTDADSDPQRQEPRDVEAEADVESELEDFRGTLDEYFHRRN